MAKLEDIVNGMIGNSQKPSIDDIVNDLLDSVDADLREPEMVDVASEIIVVDVDEILDIYGATMMYHEIVSKDKGLGSLSFIYTRLVHPVIAAMFNAGVGDNDEETQQFLRRLGNIRADDELGDFLVKNLEHRIWELSQQHDNMINIRTKELLRLCGAMAELIVVSIRDYALDFSASLPPAANARAAIQIDQRCSASVVPERNPDSLIITLNYGWVYL